MVVGEVLMIGGSYFSPLPPTHTPPLKLTAERNQVLIGRWVGMSCFGGKDYLVFGGGGRVLKFAETDDTRT